MSDDVLKAVLTDYIKEKRATRRWGIFFKCLFFAFIFLVFFLTGKDKSVNVGHKEHVAVIKLEGSIGPGSPVNAESVNSALRHAFEKPGVKGIILRVNTPGGTTVQSNLIHKQIMKLRKKSTKDSPKIYAVAEELCASGGYLIASAAESIYADEMSTVGSIGVVFPSMGFTEVMKKIGVERRLYTAGKYKAMLDPFSETSEAKDEMIQKQLDIVHEEFIKAVKNGRKDRLKESEDMFSGAHWTGVQALEMGLIDGIYDYETVAEEIIGTKVIVDYTPVHFIDKLAHTLYSQASFKFMEIFQG